MTARPHVSIPADRLARSPLLTAAGYRMLARMLEHPNAPRWNYVVGDRVLGVDLPLVESYRRAVGEERNPGGPVPPPTLLAWIGRQREEVPLFRELLLEGCDLERDWAILPTTGREDLAVRPEAFIPREADLDRLIVYDTSGTTGHAVVVPWHPRAMAQSHALMEFVLGRYGIKPDFGPEMAACFNVGARAGTVTFPTVFSVWNQAGFAKVNLHPNDWTDQEQARRFFADMAPLFLTGDPVALAEMVRWEIGGTYAALVTTAMALGPGLATRLAATYHCPVIDWYSITETGPLAYSCPQGSGLHLLPPDIFIEAVDPEGYPVPAGQRGELTVTGGRNPFLPLFRYRTGDHGRLDFSPCPCGDPHPRIMDLEGRSQVFFRAVDGSLVNPVVLARILRAQPVIQHQLLQRADGSVLATLRPAPDVILDTGLIERQLRSQFGTEREISITVDEDLGRDSPGGKVIPFKTELPLGE